MKPADESAIRALCQQWLDASMAGDNASVLALMADDAVFITPGQPPIVGKAAFAALLPANPASMRLVAKQEILEVGGTDDLAWSRSALIVTVTPPSSAQPVTRSGHTLTLFARHPSGHWLLTRDANTLLLQPGSGADVG